MPSHEIDVTATTRANPETVYALLRDGATWPEWSPLGSYELEQAGEQESEGVGAIRIFKTGWIKNREQIVELVPQRRLSYVLLSGLPIRDYRADVDLEPAGDGTLIRWHSSFNSKMPGTGWLFRRRLGRLTEELAQGLAERAQNGR